MVKYCRLWKLTENKPSNLIAWKPDKFAILGGKIPCLFILAPLGCDWILLAPTLSGSYQGQYANVGRVYHSPGNAGSIQTFQTYIYAEINAKSSKYLLT